jgi:NADPH:quinone reductase-like Zn-dependent oxidoreductase
MKAFIYEKYGPPETLRMAEINKPAPNANEVLVKVLAISVNAADWHSMRGKPLFSRATLGLLRPKHQILGVDIAGQVEAVGSGLFPRGARPAPRPGPPTPGAGQPPSGLASACATRRWPAVTPRPGCRA